MEEEDYMKQFVDNFINGLHQLAKEDKKVADEPLNGEYITQYEDWLAVGNVREEIVRCRDCAFFRASIENPIKKLCWKHTSWAYGSKIFYPEPDGYCAWGVRKEDE